MHELIGGFLFNNPFIGGIIAIVACFAIVCSGVPICVCYFCYCKIQGMNCVKLLIAQEEVLLTYQTDSPYLLSPQTQATSSFSAPVPHIHQSADKDAQFSCENAPPRSNVQHKAEVHIATSYTYSKCLICKHNVCLDRGSIWHEECGLPHTL